MIRSILTGTRQTPRQTDRRADMIVSQSVSQSIINNEVVVHSSHSTSASLALQRIFLSFFLSPPHRGLDLTPNASARSRGYAVIVNRSPLLPPRRSLNPYFSSKLWTSPPKKSPYNRSPDNKTRERVFTLLPLEVEPPHPINQSISHEHFVEMSIFDALMSVSPSSSLQNQPPAPLPSPPSHVRP